MPNEAPAQENGEQLAFWHNWTCSLHQVSGDLDDDSLTQHQDAEHGGSQITVLMS